jgi:hypothetical protein
MPDLERTVFEATRAAEYFTTRELQAQTGQPAEQLAARQAPSFSTRQACRDTRGASTATG